MQFPITAAVVAKDIEKKSINCTAQKFISNIETAWVICGVLHLAGKFVQA